MRTVFPLLTAILWIGLATTTEAAGETASEVRPPVLDEILEGVGDGALAHMQMLFQVTFLKIDIADVDVWVDAATADRLAPHVMGKKDKKENLRAAAKEVRDADTFAFRMIFRRDSGIDRMMKGTRKNLENAAKRGHITQEEASRVAGDMAASLSDLDERGIKEHDSLIYRATSDGVRTVWLSPDGEVLLDKYREGALRGRALRAAYFAEDLKFGQKLLKSLYEDD